MSHVQLCHFRDRQIQLVEIDAVTKIAVDTMLRIHRGDPKDLAARGDPDSVSWHSSRPEEPPGPEHVFRAPKLSDAFPKVIRALRHNNTPTYTEPTGETLAELTGVRIELESPIVDDCRGPAGLLVDRSN